MPRIAKGLTAIAVQNAKPGPGGKPKRYGAGGNLYLLVRPAVVREEDAAGDGSGTTGRPRTRAEAQASAARAWDAMEGLRAGTMTPQDARAVAAGRQPAKDAKAPPLVKFWLFRYTMPGGKLREMGLGSAPGSVSGAPLSLAEAREKAASLLRMVREGIDPLEDRDARKAAEAAEAERAKLRAVTFAQAVEAFLADKVEGRAGANEKHIAQWRMTLTTYALPHFGDVPVAAVEASHVLAALRPIWTTKAETASRLRGRIEAVLDYATVHKWREGPNPAMWKGNLALALKARSQVAEVEHHAALDWRRIPEFMKALREREGTSARALEFAILCASRSGEVRLATWREVDLDAAAWTIPAARMKGKREHRVPLAPAAVTLLRGLLPEDGKPDPDALIFPGMRKGTPLSDMSLGAVLKRMGHADLTAHGTARSTFRDWAGEATAHPREIIERALAHQTADKTEAAYARGDLFNKRAALMADWAAYCEKAPATVHRLHADAATAEAEA
ncbi:tyrosine-type recombinase/integrase [Siccirubricoccus phaeus]|uniref:tyrosine-type recombinase/integrase n=1 Tax=Siccirubricoccus phaeus TaxID=2595053 RepID=UPI0011F1664D|nr:site-specific integrase [Siccirubricoccus phaeus]